MKVVQCLIILMALAYCVEGRQRLGKISERLGGKLFKRQAPHRDYNTIKTPKQGLISQSVVRNSFSQNQLSAGPGQVSQINVPLIPQPQVQQTRQLNQQAQYQQAPQTAGYQQQQNQQAQYQQAPQTVGYQQQQNQQAQYQQAPQTVGYQQQQNVPQNQQAPPQAAYTPQQVSQPLYQQAPQVPSSSQYQPYVPAMAQQVAVKQTYNGGVILDRLPSNATLIRNNIIDGFSCQGRQYGYYADVANECQIFHVCVPLRAIFNNDPSVPDVTYTYSFICNEQTRFAQDSMTCAWAYEMVPCAQSEMMYSMNDNFFKITTTPATPPGYGPGSGPLPGSVPLQVGGGGGYPAGK